MRYFKYDHPKKTEKEICKAELAALNENERRLMKKSNFLNKLAISVFAAITIILLIISFCIAKSFAPKYENLLLFLILIPICQCGIFILGTVITLIISALISVPIFNASAKYDKRLKELRREHLYKISRDACEHLERYYGVQEPSIVTKCYASTESRFKKQDVQIFEYEGEVRIMRQLFGSLNLTERDAGCYTLRKGEFSLVYAEYKGKRAAILTAGETEFILAARAKPFIEKLMRYEENGIFLPASEKKSGSSAYYELAFCKKNLPPEELVQNGFEYFSADSLLFHMDDDSRFFRHYTKYFENPHTPDGSGRFFYAGVNYYTAEESAKILASIEKDAPPYSAPLIEWLRKADAYNGIFFLGI